MKQLVICIAIVSIFILGSAGLALSLSIEGPFDDVINLDGLEHTNSFSVANYISIGDVPTDYYRISEFGDYKNLGAVISEVRHLGFTGSGHVTLYTGTLSTTASVSTSHSPIPSPVLLLGTGLIGMAAFRRKMRKK